MSHFSKIKTNISNFDTLSRTITQLGFNYKLFNSDSCNILDDSKSLVKNILVYSLSKNSQKNSLFSFIWNGYQYNLVVDEQLWSLDMDLNYFIDRLSQQYAYNIILNQSISNGFQKVSEKAEDDGSIKITLQRWHSNSVC
uniref:Uncharacterized protein ycf35 n=1 Tax=Thaumatella adunca TaxID=2006976 RepID=A0A1Z1MNK4_9FLOR|nr:hypothetical protein [Thaumatella adunca]ARW67365.1 hypothetical protein [Thaumatella adunca]